MGGECEITLRDYNKKECLLMYDRNLMIKIPHIKKKEYMQWILVLILCD